MQKRLKIYLIAVNCVQGSFVMGFLLGYMNVIQTIVQQVFNTQAFGHPKLIIGLIQSLLPFGAMIGSILCGPLLDITGRNKALIFTDILTISGLGIGQIVDIYTLFASRLILGIALGLNSILVPLYIKEFTPVNIRGSVGCWNQIGLNIGLFSTFIIGIGLPSGEDNQYWRVFLLAPIVPCFIRCVLLMTIMRRDTPLYYMKIGEQEKLESVLKQIYTNSAVPKQIEELEWEQAQQNKKQFGFRQLLNPPYFARLLIGCILNVLKQFSGINSIVFYSSQVFYEATHDQDQVKFLNLSIGLANIFVSLASSPLLKLYGRQTLLIFGDTICLLGLALQIFTMEIQSHLEYQDILPIITIGSIFLFNVGFQLSFGPVIWVYLAEILPDKGLSISILVNWLCVAIVTLTFPIISKAIQLYMEFSVCFLGLFFIIFMIKETKGRSAMSIERLFYSQNPDPKSLVVDEYCEGIEKSSTMEPLRKNEQI